MDVSWLRENVINHNTKRNCTNLCSGRKIVYLLATINGDKDRTAPFLFGSITISDQTKSSGGGITITSSIVAFSSMSTVFTLFRVLIAISFGNDRIALENVSL